MTLAHIRGLHLPPHVDVEALAQSDGFAAVDGDKVLCVAGVLVLWEGRGLGWSVLGRSWRRHARAITGAVKAFLDTSPIRRIEVGVRCDHEAGHRWARRLGFKLECGRMKAWGADGLDYALYARVKNG